MKLFLILFTLLLGSVEFILAQKQNNIWYFGNLAGLDFNQDPPVPLQSDLVTLEGTASVCDPAGKLLFYTNGATVWDRNHNVMPNGTGLTGGESSTQAALIVPLPKSCSKYYLFTTEDHFTDGGLSYSIVDLCLNDGYGDIISDSKNTLVVNQTAEKITAVLHSNGTDIWIITHRLSSNQFLAYLLTDLGLNATPVISSIGSFYSSVAHIGPAKASHDGTKIVSSATFHDICEMFDFNSTTGQLSNFYNINPLFNGQQFIYGIEFSPNDSLLYLSTTFVTSNLYQLNLESKQITTLNTESGHYHYGALQLGPDRKIYMARNDSVFLDVIVQPDKPGVACQYDEGGRPLAPGTFSILGLPNFVPYSFFQSENLWSLGKDTTLCTGEQMVLSLDVPTDCNVTFEWSDGSTGSEIVVTEPGVYWVEANNDCFTFRDSILIRQAICTPDCYDTSIDGGMYGSPGVRERGLSLAPSRENDGYYVAGLKADSLLLMKFNLSGIVQWAKTIDVVPGKEDHAVSIITDSEGMIGISGVAGDPNLGGTAFVLRFNPDAQNIMWIRELIPNVTRDRVHGLNQNGTGGNYLLLSNIVDIPNSNDDFQITEFDIHTGNLVSGFSKNFHLGASETIWELVRHGDFLYGNGRYTDGAQPQNMRHVITKLDAGTFDEVWTKLGHRPGNTNARLYGFDLVIDEDFIYAGYYGDPSGTSTSNNKLYIQKTSLDGEILWLKHYEFPLSTEWGYEIVKSGNGFVVFVVNRAAEGALYLFKIDHDGNILWSRTYQVNTNINTVTYNIGSSQMIAVGDQLVFTATADNLLGEEDILIIQTDNNGMINAPCVTTQPLSLTVTDVPNGVFYDVDVEETNVQRENSSHSSQVIATTVEPLEECVQLDSIATFIDATICEGQSYESYTLSGIYQDTFLTAEGCDSIRTLTLNVIPAVKTDLQKKICTGESFEGYTQTGIYTDTFTLISGCDSIRTLQLNVYTCEAVITYDLDDCRSYMSDGSIMDYSEFDPDYPQDLDCGSFVATNLFRSPPQDNKHSCTEGLEGSLAMCISALNTCTYFPGHTSSAIIEFTVTPDVDSIIVINRLEFFEKAPATYSWVDGPSGPNNYPRYYGIRILKNGIQVFEQHDIATSLTWTLQSYDFNNNDAFNVSTPATFRIELLPYCLIGNGAAVAAWDLEDIKLYASCASPLEFQGEITGNVKTWNDRPVRDATIYLSTDPSFDLFQTTNSGFNGSYGISQVQLNTSYHLKGYKNDNLLQGVNTLDLITLQKHLLGKKLLNSLDQFIASDINHSGTLSVMDIIDLRKALLGIHSAFPNNTSWRLGIEPMNLTETNMADFKEVLFIESLNQPVSTIDILGVKIGDINRDIQLMSNDIGLQSRSNESFPIHLEEYKSEQNKTTTILFRAGEETELEGLQLALELFEFEVEEIKPGKIPMTSEHFYLDLNGTLRISFSDSKTIHLKSQDVLFSLVIHLSTSGSLMEKIKIADDLMEPEIYSSDESRRIKLDKHSPTETLASDAPLFFEISPNPFRDNFNIEFFIPKDGLVQLQIFTPVGEELYSMTREMSAGRHTEVISLGQWKGVNTVLFCRLMFDKETITRKAVKWD